LPAPAEDEQFCPIPDLRDGRSYRSFYTIALLTAVTEQSVNSLPIPAQRWPATAVDRSAPGYAPIRHGQAVFVANCLPCHHLGGAGEETVGPELLRPMLATAHFTEAGLHSLIRNPAAVRHWPAQQMPAFDSTNPSYG
jgi:mono/diheme cytochrome c family protein